MRSANKPEDVEIHGGQSWEQTATHTSPPVSRQSYMVWARGSSRIGPCRAWSLTAVERGGFVQRMLQFGDGARRWGAKRKVLDGCMEGQTSDLLLSTSWLDRRVVLSISETLPVPQHCLQRGIGADRRDKDKPWQPNISQSCPPEARQVDGGENNMRRAGVLAVWRSKPFCKRKKNIAGMLAETKGCVSGDGSP